MSEHGYSPPSSFDLNVDQCHAILDETLALLTLSDVSRPTLATTTNLNILLDKYFQDDKFGQLFRSMIIYGKQDGAEVTVASFNKFVMRPRSSNKFELRPTTRTVPTPIDSAARVELNKNILRLGYEMINFLLDYVSSNHLDRADITVFRNNYLPNKWMNGILGKVDRKTTGPFCLPPMIVVQSRIQVALEYSFLQKLDNPQSVFFSQASGIHWQPSASPLFLNEIDYEKITLEAVSLFPKHLERLLLDSKKTLDQLAGITIDVKHRQVGTAVSRLLKLALSPSFKQLDLRTGPALDAALGGTVIAIHQFLSAEFLAYYLVDHDSACLYMQDIRSSHKKDRKIRVSSIHHTSNQPIWLQFGSRESAYLYLSRTASSAEEKWLHIVNYVMKLLVNFVNNRIRRLFPTQTVPMEKLLRLRQYGTLVGTTGNPRTANYGRHHDAKPGLVDPTDARFSRYNLMVPTLCLQNHAMANTSISWFPNENPTWCAGTITQELFLFHIQGVGVQEHFEHQVRFLYHYIILIAPPTGI